MAKQQRFFPSKSWFLNLHFGGALERAIPSGLCSRRNLFDCTVAQRKPKKTQMRKLAKVICCFLILNLFSSSSSSSAPPQVGPFSNRNRAHNHWACKRQLSTYVVEKSVALGTQSACCQSLNRCLSRDEVPVVVLAQAQILSNVPCVPGGRTAESCFKWKVEASEANLKTSAILPVCWLLFSEQNKRTSKGREYLPSLNRTGVFPYFKGGKMQRKP